MAVVCEVKMVGASDATVFVTQKPEQAHLLVCKVEHRGQAEGDDALWCFVPHRGAATSLIFFCKSHKQAELYIHYVDKPEDAMWRVFFHPLRGVL